MVDMQISNELWQLRPPAKASPQNHLPLDWDHDITLFYHLLAKLSEQTNVKSWGENNTQETN